MVQVEQSVSAVDLLEFERLMELEVFTLSYDVEHHQQRHNQHPQQTEADPADAVQTMQPTTSTALTALDKLQRRCGVSV